MAKSDLVIQKYGNTSVQEKIKSTRMFTLGKETVHNCYDSYVKSQMMWEHKVSNDFTQNPGIGEQQSKSLGKKCKIKRLFFSFVCFTFDNEPV